MDQADDLRDGVDEDEVEEQLDVGGALIGLGAQVGAGSAQEGCGERGSVSRQ